MPSIPTDRRSGPHVTTASRSAPRVAPTTTETALIPKPLAGFVQTFQLDRDKIDLIKATVCPKGTTDNELGLYLHECARRGCHPMDRLIVMTRFRSNDDDDDSGEGGKLVFMTTIDYLRARAGEDPLYAGTDEATFSGETTVSYKGKTKKAPEKAVVKGFKIVQGVRVKMADGVARWSEFYPGEKRGSMWFKMPHNQLAKCAEAQALRKMEPQKLRRLYIPEELEHLGPDFAKPVGRGSTIPQPQPPPPVDTVSDQHAPEASDVPPAERWVIASVIAGQSSKGVAVWKVEADNGARQRAAFYTTDKPTAEACERLQKHRTLVTIDAKKESGVQMITEVAPLTPQ